MKKCEYCRKPIKPDTETYYTADGEEVCSERCLSHMQHEFTEVRNRYAYGTEISLKNLRGFRL